MKSFIDLYLERVALTRSILCVGLDPTPSHVPPAYGKRLVEMEQYLIDVIDAAADRVPVVKPQYAYYAAMGTEYVRMMIRLIEHAHEKGMLAILDGKRADIGETMEQYGDEVFGQYGVDACTFVPYLGATFMPSKSSPGWLSWLKKGKCAITMVRTSNKEAEQIQDLELKNGLRVYEQLACYAREWHDEILSLTSSLGSVGGVVGATWPEQAPRCRELAGDNVFFLIPGYGPGQGGGADGAVGGLPCSKGRLLGTVNNSRGTTLYSWWDREKREPKKGDPMELVIASIDEANRDLNAAIERKIGITIEAAANKGIAV